jgi:hypothetical protein
MTRIDELPPDRRAVLSLILRRRKSYAEIAAALEIAEVEVREQALDALEELAGAAAGALDASERERIGDYLLAQQSPAERLVTYDELEGSAQAREFAQTVAAELSSISSATLPDIPGDADGAPAVTAPPRRRRTKPAAATARADNGAPLPEVVEEPPAPPTPRTVSRPQPPKRARDARVAASGLPSSRLGGAIVLALIVIGAIVAIVLATSSGGGSAGAKRGSSAAVSAGSTGATGAGQVRLNKQIRLSPPAGGSAVGAAAVLSEAGKYVVALAAEHLPPSQGFFYAAWLYNSPTHAVPLGKAPSVGSDGQLKPVAQALPENASNYHQLVITKETSERPSQPGEIVLSGPFSLH